MTMPRSEVTIDLGALQRNAATLLRALDGAELWAVVAFAVLTSVVLHGITATPIMDRLDTLRDGRPRDVDRAGN